MKRTFIRSLMISAVLQFIVTRQRAGHVLEEGAAEQMWMRYPLVVLLNAVTWTLMLSTIGRIVRPLRA